MLLEHLRTVFPLERRNAELGLDAVVRNAGGEATENEAPSRYTRAAEPSTQKQMLLILSRLALKHDLKIRELQAATFRTLLVKQDEPLMLASKGVTGLCGQIEGGTATSGRAACQRMGGHDDGYDHEPSTLGGRRAESGDIHVQCEFTGDPLAEHLLEPVQKNNSEGFGQVAVFSGLPDSAHLVPHHQSHEIEGSQREVRPSSRMQAGEKGGQQLLTSWIRPKMPSIVRS